MIYLAGKGKYDSISNKYLFEVSNGTTISLYE
jgi:hypothetical protein